MMGKSACCETRVSEFGSQHPCKRARYVSCSPVPAALIGVETRRSLGVLLAASLTEKWGLSMRSREQNTWCCPLVSACTHTGLVTWMDIYVHACTHTYTHTERKKMRVNNSVYNIKEKQTFINKFKKYNPCTLKTRTLSKLFFLYMCMYVPDVDIGYLFQLLSTSYFEINFSLNQGSWIQLDWLA